MRNNGRESPTVSTVTSLFMRDDVLGSGDRNNINTKSPYKIQYNNKVYKSASKVLENYIQNYDKEQTWNLAKSLTENCTNTPIKREARRMRKNTGSSTIEKEIRLAKQLLPTSYTNDVNMDGNVDMEDLLISHNNQDNNKPTLNMETSLKYRRNLNNEFRSSQSQLPIVDNDDYDVTDNSVSDTESTTSWDTLSSYPSKYSSHNRRRKPRKVLKFYSEDETTSAQSSTSTTPRVRYDSAHRVYDESANTSSDDQSTDFGFSDAQTKSQFEDLQRTLRLVDDLKADFAAAESTLGVAPRPDQNSLSDLILRLSVAAKRKEDKLRQTLVNRKSLTRNHEESLHFSDLDLTNDTRSKQKGNLKSSSYNPEQFTPTYRGISRYTRGCTSAPSTPAKKYSTRPHNTHQNMKDETSYSTTRQQSTSPNKTLNTSVLTTDNISEAMRLIDDRRFIDMSSNTLQSDAPSTSATDVLLSNPLNHEVSANQESDWGHVVEPPTTPTNPISTLHAGRTPFIHRSVTPSVSPTSTDEILDAERTWERLPVKRKSGSDTSSHISVSFCMEGKPLAVKGFMEECMMSSKSNNTSLSGGNHPGSVEALKNMIFTLQGMTSQCGAGDYIQEEHQDTSFNGQKSLEKAIVHLNNLKNIVEK
ncbi:uncharacterized protein LOC100186732 isoform X2 [Ciona intestinalis]